MLILKKVTIRGLSLLENTFQEMDKWVEIRKQVTY